MRAVVYDKLGDSSVLEVVDRDVPEPHWGEVRVRLAVAGVNPTDWKFRAGATASDAAVRRDRARARTAPGSSTRSATASPASRWATGSGSTSPSTTGRSAPPGVHRRPGRASRPPARRRVVRRGREPRRPGDDRPPRADRPRGRADPARARAPSRAAPCWSPAARARWATPRSSSPPGPGRPWSRPSAATRRRALATRGRSPPRRQLPHRRRGRRDQGDRARRASTWSSRSRSSRTPTWSPRC